MPTRCNRGFYCRSYCLLNMFRAPLCQIIRSSRVLYSGCCLWNFVLWFSSCWSGVELRVMCPVCRMLQHPANRESSLICGNKMPTRCTYPTLPQSYNHTLQTRIAGPQTETTVLYPAKNLPRTPTHDLHDTRHTLQQT